MKICVVNTLSVFITVKKKFQEKVGFGVVRVPYCTCGGTRNLSQTKTFKKYVILYIVRKLITLALQCTYDQLKWLCLSKVITKKVKKLQFFLQFFEIIILGVLV